MARPKHGYAVGILLHLDQRDMSGDLHAGSGRTRKEPLLQHFRTRILTIFISIGTVMAVLQLCSGSLDVLDDG